MPPLQQTMPNSLRDIIAPQAPTNVTARPVTQDDATFDWTKRVDQESQFTMPEIKPPSGMATLLGYVALAQGQVGPLMQLQEQKRKSGIAKSAAPIFGEANKLLNEGKYDEATKLVTQAAGNLGPRVPELMPFIQEFQADIKRRQNVRKSLDTVIGMRKAAKLSTEASGNEWPSSQKALDAALAVAQKNENFLSDKQLSEFIERNKPDRRVEADRRTLRDLFGNMDVAAQENVARPTQYSDYTLNRLGVQSQDLANFFNNEGQLLYRGSLYGPTEGNQLFFRDKLAEIQEEERLLTVAKNIPIDPLIADAEQRAGATPFEVATRDVPLDIRETALNQYFQRGTLQQRAPLEARLAYPSHMSNPPGVTLDNESGAIVRDVPLGAALQSPGRYSVFNEPKTAARAQQLVDFRNRLLLFLPKIQTLPITDNVIDRTAFFGVHRLNEVVQFDPKITSIQILQNIVGEGIERLVNQFNIPASRFANVRKMLDSGFASQENAIAAVEDLYKLYDQEYRRYISSNRAATPLPDIPGVGRGTTAPTTVPTAPTVTPPVTTTTPGGITITPGRPVP